VGDDRRSPPLVGEPETADASPGIATPEAGSLPGLEIWFDGSCEICRASRRLLEREGAGCALSFHDLAGWAPPPEARGSAPQRDEVLVRLPDGKLLAGFEAWRAILAALPRWRWLSAVAGLPGVARFGRMAYRAVARHRHRLVRVARRV